jgi:tetratricopeptide (TPR) repeat protein
MTVDLALALQAAGRPEEAMRVTEDALDQAGALASEAAVVAWYRAVMKAASGDAHAAAVLNDRLKSTEVGLWEDRHSLLAHMAALDEGPRRQAAAAANLALALSRAGADHAAVAQLRILEGVLPGERLPLCWQTNMLDLQGKHQEAVGRYEQLIREHPDWTYVRLLLALSHARHGESDSAIAVLQQALPDASPDLAGPICLNLGGLYQQQGLLDAALSCYQAAQEDPGAAPYACNNMAWIMAAHRGDLAAAQPLAERALELAPGFLDALDTLGWIHYLQGDAAKAVELLEKARAGLPSVPTVRYHLGMAYLKAGRRAEAKAELEEALAVSATFPEAGEAADALRAL